MKLQAKGIAPIGIISLIAAVIVIGAAVYYLAVATNNSNTNTQTNTETMEDDTIKENDDTMMEDKNSNDAMIENKNTNDATMEEKNVNEAMQDDDQASAEGEYTTYSESKFASASSKKRVLFFYASWCPTCRPADANITANVGRIPADVVVFRTDYDNEDALKAKYGVTYQHTFVQVDENGNAIKKWNGGDIDEIIKNVI